MAHVFFCYCKFHRKIKFAKAKVNNDINKYPIVKIKLVNKYKAIYKIMSEAQKKASEPWPSFPPPPPPAPKVKKGEKSNIPPPPPPPVKATPKQLAEYNTLAKKYNAQPINEGVLKLKDLKKLEYVYGKMSLKQKENAQPFPECPRPPPSPVVQKGEKSNIPPPPPQAYRAVVPQIRARAFNLEFISVPLYYQNRNPATFREQAHTFCRAKVTYSNWIYRDSETSWMD